MAQSYTTDDIARLLQVSKLTVYDLIKKGDLPAYRVGRQMRIDALDFERYKSRGKEVKHVTQSDSDSLSRPIVISGQDSSLDILAKALEKRSIKKRPLRSYASSMDGLIALYNGEADIVSVHLLDGDTGEYNISYIRKLLVSNSFMVISFIKRSAGFYVAKGNPKDIQTWSDLTTPSVVLTNREKGAGARVLLDEQLRVNNIKGAEVSGYADEETSHLAVASAIANERADVGIGIEQVTKLANIDFVPMVTESYDLVMLKKPENVDLITDIRAILTSESFQQELSTLGYNVEQMGEILWEE